MPRSAADPIESMPAVATKRPVGRPKLRIDPEQVAAVAAKLYDEQGFDAVSIETVADGLGVSRATLYRTVRSLDDLHAILLERVIHAVESDARTLLESHSDAKEALTALLRFQVHASVRMRNYVSVYFGWGLSPETYVRWRDWAGGYEALWTEAVENAVKAGYLESDDIKVTTRLILGMVNWVSRWYRAKAGDDPDEIGDAAVKLIFPPSGPATRRRATPSTSRPAKR